MKFSISRSFVATSLALGLSVLAAPPALAQAQGGGQTRAQVKMDRDTFLSMARYDEAVGSWVLRDDMPMPAGVSSRDEIKAMRDKFLSMNTWNDKENIWVPVGGAPRNMSTLKREQVQTETAMFLKMFRFNGMTSQWERR